MMQPHSSAAVAALVSALLGTLTALPTVAQTSKAAAPASVKLPSQAQWTVIEDDSTRIETLRTPGNTERLVVKSKRVNLPAWEIRTSVPGRQAAAESRLPQDSANQRMWSVLSF